MQGKRQGLTWWHVLPPFFVVGSEGGLLGLESHTSLVPDSHSLACLEVNVLINQWFVGLFCLTFQGERNLCHSR